MRFLRSSSTGMNATSTWPASSASVASPELGNSTVLDRHVELPAERVGEVGGDAARLAVRLLHDEEDRHRRREHQRDAQLSGGHQLFHGTLVRGRACREQQCQQQSAGVQDLHRHLPRGVFVDRRRARTSLLSSGAPRGAIDEHRQVGRRDTKTGCAHNLTDDRRRGTSPRSTTRWRRARSSSCARPTGAGPRRSYEVCPELEARAAGARGRRHPYREFRHLARRGGTAGLGRERFRRGRARCPTCSIIVRLAASAVLAEDAAASARRMICDAILDGYREGHARAAADRARSRAQAGCARSRW